MRNINEYIQANTDGRLHPADSPSLSPLNRGFLYGDAIYEVWRTYAGVVFAYEEHWERLRRSAAALFIDLPWSREEMFGEIRRTAEAFAEAAGGRAELYIRLQIARGGGPIGLDPGLADRPSFVLLVQKVGEVAPARLREGLKLSLARGLRRNSASSLNPAWKTGNYLNNILCLREARARGADEVVMINLQGEVTEAATSNVFFVAGSTVVTPPLSAGILEGITRHLILREVIPAAGFSAAEEPIRPEDFPRFEECFLSSSTKDITPVASIDGQAFRVSETSAARRLKTAFAGSVARYNEANARWRLLG